METLIDMKYKISELTVANEEFRKIFGTGLPSFLENQITAATSQLVLNVVDFHKYLEKEKPGNTHKSFNALIIDEYGTEGLKLITKLTL